MPPRTTPWRLFRRKDSPVWWARRIHRGRKERVSTGFARKGEAERLIDAWNRQAADPIHASAQATTLAQAVQRWLTDIGPRISEATMDVYTTKAGQLIRVLGRDAPLGDIHARAIDAYVEDRKRTYRCPTHRSGDPEREREPCSPRMCAKGVTDSTVHKELQVLRWVLELAKRRGEYAADPSVASHPSKYVPRQRWLTRDEAEALYHLVHQRFGPHRAAHFAFFLASGARLSEAARARREDIRVREITGVRVAMVHLHGTKTKRAERVVAMTRLSGPWLERALNDAPGRGEGPLFTVWVNLQRDLRNACSSLGMASAGPNDLRRTFASWHLHAGVERSIVAAMLGHSSTAMLDAVYGVHTPETRAALMAEFLWHAPAPAPTAPGLTKSTANVIELDAERRRRRG